MDNLNEIRSKGEFIIRKTEKKTQKGKKNYLT